MGSRRGGSPPASPPQGFAGCSAPPGPACSGALLCYRPPTHTPPMRCDPSTFFPSPTGQRGDEGQGGPAAQLLCQRRGGAAAAEGCRHRAALGGGGAGAAAGAGRRAAAGARGALRQHQHPGGWGCAGGGWMGGWVLGVGSWGKGLLHGHAGLPGSQLLPVRCAALRHAEHAERAVLCRARWARCATWSRPPTSTSPGARMQQVGPQSSRLSHCRIVAFGVGCGVPCPVVLAADGCPAAVLLLAIAHVPPAPAPAPAPALQAPAPKPSCCAPPPATSHASSQSLAWPPPPETSWALRTPPAQQPPAGAAWRRCWMPSAPSGGLAGRQGRGGRGAGWRCCCAAGWFFTNPSPSGLPACLP